MDLLKVISKLADEGQNKNSESEKESEDTHRCWTGKKKMEQLTLSSLLVGRKIKWKKKYLPEVREWGLNKEITGLKFQSNFACENLASIMLS